MKIRSVNKFAVITVILAGCLEPYEPPTVKGNPDYLVVDAFLNSKSGVVSVDLFHTVPLASSERPDAETGADVSIEDEDGNAFFLTENESGSYSQSGLSLPPELRYRLHIRTQQGKEYYSQFIEQTISPEIDSVSFAVIGDELDINVNTHDPSGKSVYYRWTFAETWKYQTQYFSAFVIKDGVAHLRAESENINVCYRTDRSKLISLGTSKFLTEDRINNFTLVSIPRGSLKISQRYSINVTQQVLSQEAYDYWLELQKTTESLGGLFDPMPSQVVGNIYSATDPSEQVIGYFSGGSVSEKRIYISPQDLPTDFADYRYGACNMDTIDVVDLPLFDDPNVLIGAIYPPGSIIPSSYTTAEPPCRDCRQLANGVTQKPDFWQD